MLIHIVVMIVVGLVLFHYSPKLKIKLNEYILSKYKQFSHADKLRDKIKRKENK